jgi:hypothetical protein
MQIKPFAGKVYDENTPYIPGRLVFQTHYAPYAGECVSLHFPLPERCRDCEIDLDDAIIPVILFAAMVGRNISTEELHGMLWEITLPEGVFNE